MAFISNNASPELIRTAAKLHDLDDACRLIQGSLGIDSKDVASQFFNGIQELEWPSLSEVSRLRLLVDYATELRAAHTGPRN